MVMLTTTNNVNAITPDQYGDRVLRPALDLSVFAQVSSLAMIGSTEYRVPVVVSDAGASWVVEGAEIAPSDAQIAEILVTPAKIAALSILSRELADDTSPGAAEIVGAGMARSLARKLDEAVFAGLSSPAPAGLPSLVGKSTYIDAAAFDDLDWSAHALAIAEDVGATVTAFITSPAVALQLATIKISDGSNAPILGSDPTSPTKRQVSGVPLFVSRYVQPNTIWAVDQSTTFLVVRDNAEVEASEHAMFTSDRIALRATMRASWAFPHPAAVVKITLS